MNRGKIIASNAQIKLFNFWITKLLSRFSFSISKLSQKLIVVNRCVIHEWNNSLENQKPNRMNLSNFPITFSHIFNSFSIENRVHPTMSIISIMNVYSFVIMRYELISFSLGDAMQEEISWNGTIETAVMNGTKTKSIKN